MRALYICRRPDPNAHFTLVACGRDRYSQPRPDLLGRVDSQKYALVSVSIEDHVCALMGSLESTPGDTQACNFASLPGTPLPHILTKSPSAWVKAA